MRVDEAFPPKQYADVADHTGEAAQIALALKGRQSGNGWAAKCPGHDDRRESLSIREEDGRLLLHCFAGCEFQDIIDVLRDRGVIGADRRDRGRRALAYVAPAKAPTEHAVYPRAAWLWNDSIPLHGTPAEVYLERRGILITPPSLRFHRATCAMLAGFQRPDGRLVGVQSTALTPSGEKASDDCRRTYTEMRDGAVRLAAAAEVTGLAEGVETGLSAMALSATPVWVSLGSKRLHDVVLPELVREVHIFGDNGQPGRDAAQRTAEVHKRAGRRVKLRFPPDGISDFNDLVIALADCDGDADRLMADLRIVTAAPNTRSAA